VASVAVVRSRLQGNFSPACRVIYHMVCVPMKNIPANGDRDLIQVEAKLQSYLFLTHIALMTFAIHSII